MLTSFIAKKMLFFETILGWLIHLFREPAGFDIFADFNLQLQSSVHTLRPDL